MVRSYFLETEGLRYIHPCRNIDKVHLCEEFILVRWSEHNLSKNEENLLKELSNYSIWFGSFIKGVLIMGLELVKHCKIELKEGEIHEKNINNRDGYMSVCFIRI